MQRRDPLQTLRILWAALMGSVVMYAFVLVATGKVEPRSPPPDAVLFVALSGVAVMVGAMSVALPKMGHRNAAGLAAAKLPVDEGQEYSDRGDHGFREAAGVVRLRVFREPERAEAAAFQAFFTPFILGMALAEAVANFGLVLGFMGFGAVKAAPFFLVALLLQATRFPTREGVLARFEEAAGARFPKGYLRG